MVLGMHFVVWQWRTGIWWSFKFGATWQLARATKAYFHTASDSLEHVPRLICLWHGAIQLCFIDRLIDRSLPSSLIWDMWLSLVTKQLHAQTSMFMCRSSAAAKLPMIIMHACCVVWSRFCFFKFRSISIWFLKKIAFSISVSVF